MTQEAVKLSNPTSLFAEGILQGIAGLQEGEKEPEAPQAEPEAEPKEDATEEPEAPEAEPEEDSEPEPEPESEPEEPKAKAKHSVSEWAQALATDGIKRLSEIPPRMHQEVVAEYNRITIDRARAEERQQIAQTLRAERELRAYIDKVDATFQEDPQAKLDWLQSGQPEAKVYLDGKQYLSSVSGQTPEQRVDGISALTEGARRQYGRLDGFPELKTKVESMAAQGRYPSTQAGLDQLSRDIDALFVEAARGQHETPAAKTATPRQTRRPLVTGGNQPTAKRSDIDEKVAKSKNPQELVAMGIESQIAKLNGRR